MTGAQKGGKLARYDLLPYCSLTEVAKVFGFGSKKYEDRNWEKGYPFGWSYAALQRHLAAFWSGENTDPESGLPHLAHAAWHCLVLMEFMRTGRGTDDRSRMGEAAIPKIADARRAEIVPMVRDPRTGGVFLCDSLACTLCRPYRGIGE